MKATIKEIRKIIREELKQIIKEHSDWHNDEHETLADRKFADRDWAPPSLDDEDLEDENGAIPRPGEHSLDFGDDIGTYYYRDDE